MKNNLLYIFVFTQLSYQYSGNIFKLLGIWINTVKFHFSVVLEGQTNFDLFYMVIAKAYLYTDKDKCYIYSHGK